MPKVSDNFLRGWCRQLRQALDDGTELGYEAAELIEEVSDLLSPRDSDVEMGDVESDGDCEDDSDTSRDVQGTAQADLPGVSGVGGDVEHPCGPVRGPLSVPRGTGSDASVLEPRVTRTDKVGRDRG